MPTTDIRLIRNNRGCCARGACQKEFGHRHNHGAWINRGNGLLYCKGCAHAINRYNPLCEPTAHHITGPETDINRDYMAHLTYKAMKAAPLQLWGFDW